MIEFSSTVMQNLDPANSILVGLIFLGSAVVKGFLGIGLPAAAMAFLTLFMSPKEAIPLLWLPILATNFLQFARAPGKWDIAREYWLFAASIIVFIFVTSMFIAEYPTAVLTVAIGAAMVLFSLNLLLGFKLPIGPGRIWQGVFGVISGTLGGISSIWSPTVAMYLVARNVEKDRFIGATGFLFLAGVLPLGAGQVVAGILTLPVLMKSVLALFVVLVGFRIGEAFRAHVSQALFRTAVLVAFLLMGLRLVVTGLV